MTEPVGERASIVREASKLPIHIVLVLALIAAGWYQAEVLQRLQDSMIKTNEEFSASIAESMDHASKAAERQADALESLASSAKLEEHDDNALIEILELMKRNQGC